MRCLLTRWYLSRALDDDAPLPPWVRQHLLRCARCAHAHQATRDLHRNLALHAVAMRQGSEPLPTRQGFRDPLEEQRPSPEPSGGFRLRLVLGSAGALASLILLALWQNPRTVSQALPDGSLWSASWRLPVEQAWNLPEKIENPLNQEVDQLKSTLGQAGRFLYESIRIPLPGEPRGS